MVGKVKSYIVTNIEIFLYGFAFSLGVGAGLALVGTGLKLLSE